MNKPNLYSYIAILFVVVIILSLTVWVLQRKKDIIPTEPTDLTQPTPTTIEVRTTIPPTPAEISPTSTGVFEEELPKEQQDLADQKQELKSKTPVINPNFTIIFDYGEDKFIVDLKEPKTESEKKFEEWLSTNYPAIPIDRFILR